MKINAGDGGKLPKPSRKALKRILIVLISFVFLLAAGTGIYIYALLNMIQEVPLAEGPGNQTGDPSDVPMDRPRPPTREELEVSDRIPETRESGIINVLLLGVDSGAPDEASRSDAMMIATIDTKNNRIKLTSLMRDMYVPIPGRQESNRINTGYIFGGPALAIRTVNHNFQMNIEHYAAVGFDGFRDIIDLLGGVEVTLTAGEARIVGLTRAGTYELNGEQALAYSRIRSIGGDYERTDRQRTVLSALFQKGRTLSLLRIPDVLSGILPHIETNLTKSEILRLGFNVLESGAGDLEEYRLPAPGTYQHRRINNRAVLAADLELNTQKLHQFIYGEENPPAE